MTVEQSGTIDIVSIDKDGKVVLTISDHLDWGDSVRHQLLLQAKFNAYLAFIENGDISKQYPDSEGRQILFRVVSKFKPDVEGMRFFAKAAEVIKSTGFEFELKLFAESYDN
jgi:hypothetical protein